MAIHATARIDWIQARLMGWLRTQTLTGSPAIAEADEPALAHLAGPWARVTFDELPPTPIGRWDATHSAMRMALVMSVELFGRHRQPRRARCHSGSTSRRRPSCAS